MGGYVYIHAVTHKCQKRGSKSLKLELQEVVGSRLMWGLRTQLRSSEKVLHAYNC